MDTTEGLHFHFSLSCIGEGNGNPLQCSCLENLMDRGTWPATVCGVTKSRTQLRAHCARAHTHTHTHAHTHLSSKFILSLFTLLNLNFLSKYKRVSCMRAKSFQSCLTLCDPIDCSTPGSSIHGIFQARILEWFAMPSSRESSQTRDQTHVSYIYLH